ncbi:MAG: hypothetical protein ACR2OG_09785 [Gemmatimonadaceae bacterium]
MPAVRPVVPLIGSLLVALLMLPTCVVAQSRTREMGSYHYGDAVVWIKATDRGVVELFVARGYRDAFTRANEITADSLEQWADSSEMLAGSVPSSGGPEIVYAGQGAPFGSVVLERHLGGPTPGLRLHASVISARITEPGARELTGTLRAAAQVTRLLSSASLAAAPVPASPEPRPSADVIAQTLPGRIASAAPVPPPITVAAPAKRAPVRAPAVSPDSANAARSDSSAAVTPQPVFFEDSVFIVRGNVRVSAKAVARARRLALSSSPAGRADAADSAARRDQAKRSATARLLDMQSCYQIAGLSRNPKLGGALLFLLQIGETGAARSGVIVGRSWQGTGARATERCLSEKITGWTFPNRAGVGAYQFTASFVP